MIIEKYVKPESIKEAYDILKTEYNSEIIAGGAFSHITNKNINTAIDLSKTKMDYIIKNNDCIEIGAMTTLREIENSNVLSISLDGVLNKATSNILGVQLRNIATIGGTVYGRFGFSDLIPVLLSLDCSIQFYGSGKVKIEEFLNEFPKRRDIIEKIIINNIDGRASYKFLRKTSADFPILNCSVFSGETVRIAVGARPGIAQIVNINKMEEISFGSDLRASSEYRKQICSVLIKRALEEVGECY